MVSPLQVGLLRQLSDVMLLCDKAMSVNKNNKYNTATAFAILFINIFMLGMYQSDTHYWNHTDSGQNH